MNTSIDLNAEGAPPATVLPLSLLALLDLAMLKRQYAQLVNEPERENRWFVMRGTEALPPMAFREVLWRLAKGEGPLVVLREAEAEQDPTPWRTIDHRACASNRATALTVIVGFWMVAVVFGWVAINVLGPRAHQSILGKIYFVVALVAVVWLSLPKDVRGRPRK